MALSSRKMKSLTNKLYMADPLCECLPSLLAGTLDLLASVISVIIPICTWWT